jgi:carboxymethylenebutenolidase
VIKDAIGVQGWSNGGMTVLVTMSDRAPGIDAPSPQSGFRAAIAEYPACGMEAVQGHYHAYAPVLLMIASADEEVSPKRCVTFARHAQLFGSDVEPVVYDGAEHNFDDPAHTKQSNPANRRATEDAMQRAAQFFQMKLRSHE